MTIKLKSLNASFISASMIVIYISRNLCNYISIKISNKPKYGKKISALRTSQVRPFCIGKNVRDLFEL